jgi:ABC-2 type transport system ATP-binding protein
MLSIDDLHKTYRSSRQPALEGVSFSVAEGAFVALLGPNGAGKSTLINILAGRVDAERGAIRIAGQELGPDRPELRALIGIVPQEIRFDYIFTVEELLNLEAGYYGLRRDDAHVRYLLERLALTDKLKVRSRELSGGMQRRLMIARALVHRPRLLLLDEPTAGVDLNLRQDMYGFLRELNDAGTTIVLTTHYLEEAEHLCERILVLDHGRLIAHEAREEFLRLAGDVFTVQIQTDQAERLWPLFEIDGAMPVPDERAGLRFVYPADRRESLLRGLTMGAPDIQSFQILKPKLEEVFVKLTHSEASHHVHVA